MLKFKKENVYRVSKYRELFCNIDPYLHTIDYLFIHSFLVFIYQRTNMYYSIFYIRLLIRKIYFHGTKTNI